MALFNITTRRFSAHAAGKRRMTMIVEILPPQMQLYAIYFAALKSLIFCIQKVMPVVEFLFSSYPEIISP
jgi:hypothetical protein